MALPYFKDNFFTAQSKPLIDMRNPMFQDIELSIMKYPPIQAWLVTEV